MDGTFEQYKIYFFSKRDRNNCPRAHLQIGGDRENGAANAAGSIYCGGSLNSVRDHTVDGVITCKFTYMISYLFGDIGPLHLFKLRVGG